MGIGDARGAEGGSLDARDGRADAAPLVDDARDSASDGASDPCAMRPGLRFCDTFERATPDAGSLPAPWQIQINGDATALVAVDATTAHSGSRSIHVTGTGFQTFFALHDPSVLPAPAGRFYLRLFIRPLQAMSDGHNTFFTADLFAMPGGGNAARIGEDFDMLMMSVGGDAHAYLSHQNHFNDGLFGVQFTPGRWSCVEVLFDAPHTEIDVWVDGVEVPDMHPTNIVQDAYDTLHFGFEKYAGPPAEFWYDDIAVGTERIGCD
jgi:hypothetical protein